MQPTEPLERAGAFPFSCPVCLTGIGLPNAGGPLGSARSGMDLCCQSCGHEWQLTRSAPVEPTRPAAPTLRSIAACRMCTQLIEFEMTFDRGSLPHPWSYVCPHCGTRDELRLSGSMACTMPAGRRTATPAA